MPVQLLTPDVLMQIDREGMNFVDEADFTNLVEIARWAQKACDTLRFFDNYPGVKALLAEVTPPSSEGT